MSIDGPEIIASDLAHDVYNKILDLYDAGVLVDEIRTHMVAIEDELFDDLDLEIYLAASAKAFWEIGHLQASLKDRLSDLMESGTSTALWEENGDTALARERKSVLQRFLRQIASPRSRPRARKKYSKIDPKLFSVGDCLELATDVKTYRGVVCRVREYRGKCTYAILLMRPKTGSTNKSFTSGYYYGRQIPSDVEKNGYILGPHVILPEHRMLLREGNPFRIVAHVDLDEKKFTLGSLGGVLEMSHVIADFERTQTKSKIFYLELRPLKELFRD